MPPTRQQKRQLERAAARVSPSPQMPAQWADSPDDVEVCGDLLLIEVLQAGESRGGIALPDSYREEGPQRGIVVKTGPGLRRDDGTYSKLECEVGDKVYLQFPRSPLSINLGGKEHLLIPDNLVIMKVAKKSEIAVAG